MTLEVTTPRHVLCPLCHTMSPTLADQALATADDWRCVRCGQQWSARRLATVAAYAAWDASRFTQKQPPHVEARLPIVA